ncbi:MAG: protoporphyrinogen oxidase [endosymbiont of Seepiophila jonesi]|uniref:Protoporphyrinogen oxidase n=1 Tax=endosymbiont of Lamellibrachia luymesi TaxID=2200907 RepID=A0A370E068_9GAMM|nr:MAG: protoporphyrinogen oxidase [endosymbiont of Seepiophila jonesi]RDH92619.1 MAG: protoporphyrinogen oxidase [endosymbiont of Lamellibrachia luymesi]
MNQKVVELAVVGAGISGLGFAHMSLQQGIQPLVLEASEQVGGCLHSHCFDTPEGEFWTELGAHTCYNSYGNLLQMLEDTGQLESLLKKEKLPYRLLTPAGLKSIPSQLRLTELLGVLPRLFRSKKAGHTVKEYFGGIIGEQNFQKVIGPALDAVTCQPSAEFPADALFRKKPRRKEILRSYTVAGGVQQFADVIAAQSGLEIRTGISVVGLDRLERGYLLKLSDGSEIEAQRLALAVAPDIAATLLQSVNSELAALLSQVGMVDIESVSVFCEAEKLSLEPVSGIIGQDDDFYSALSRDPVPDARYRGFTFHFRPGRLDEAGQLERIRAVLGLAEQDLLATISKTNHLPALRLGHGERVTSIDRILLNQPLALTGNWFSGVSIEDSLVRSATEFGRLFPV